MSTSSSSSSSPAPATSTLSSSPSPSALYPALHDASAEDWVLDLRVHSYSENTLPPTARVGPYLLHSHIADGEFCETWRAYHNVTGELVAIKFFRPKYRQRVTPLQWQYEAAALLQNRTRQYGAAAYQQLLASETQPQTIDPHYFHSTTLQKRNDVARQQAETEKTIFTHLQDESVRAALASGVHSHLIYCYEVHTNLRILTTPQTQELEDGCSDTGIYSSYCFVLQYAENGDLLSYLMQGALPERIARMVFLQVIHSVTTMHMKQTYHVDLKLEQLLVHEDMTLSLCDMGMSKSVAIPHALNKYIIGTKSYAPPELFIPVEQIKTLQSQQNARPLSRPLSIYDERNTPVFPAQLDHRQLPNGSKHHALCDVYTLGMMLFILVTGLPPYMMVNLQCPLYRRALRRDWYKLFTESEKKLGYALSDSVKDLIMHLLESDPAQRCSLTQVLVHPWLNEEADKIEAFRLYVEEMTKRRAIIKKQQEEKKLLKQGNPLTASAHEVAESKRRQQLEEYAASLRLKLQQEEEQEQQLESANSQTTVHEEHPELDNMNDVKQDDSVHVH